MLKFIAILSVLPALASAIKTLVVEFETPGFGESKKEAVLGAIRAGFIAFEKLVVDTPLTVDDILPVADKLVDIWVAFYNFTGKFKHTEEKV